MSRLRTTDYIGPLLLALAIGVLAGLGAVIFREMIALGQDLLWPGGDNFVDRFTHAPTWLKLLIPLAAGLIAGPVITFWAPEVRGPGVPEVMESLTLRGGRIRHRVTAIKALVTAGIIAAGGSVGREGPIVQIGSSIGSSITQIFRLRPENTRLAVACGAAAGIAATFQAPMAGILFAVEILLFDLEVGSLSHIIVAAVTGTMITRFFYGAGPLFYIPGFVLSHPLELVLYFILGLAAGILSLFLMGILFGLPKFFRALKVPEWLTPAIGGLLLGLAGLVCPWALGVGYESINLSLTGDVTLSFVLILVCAKLFTTGICIGSGMSGGIFAPSLVLGAMLGSLAGFITQLIFPQTEILPAYCTLIGMGAMVSGTTLAPITAILTIFELTDNYEVILPLMIACIASVLVVRLLHGYSVYETKLLQKGIDIVKGHEVNILRGMRVIDYMRTDVQYLHMEDSCQKIIQRMDESPYPQFVVLDKEQKLSGVLTLTDFKTLFAHPEKCGPESCAGEMMKRDVVTVTDNDNMEKAFHSFVKKRVSFLPVVSRRDPRRIVGQIRKAELFAAYEQHVIKEHFLSPLGWVCPLPAKQTESKIK
ncbi:MAG: chloride channel protein [Deltaproteobacteria bacterium]|jgi:CIC family chloride channel protein|nr:chloride channel protein [Deltaproteobacteria bacterium]